MIARGQKEIILKICGLMREKDVLLCKKLGVQIAGFVVDYPKAVPWNLQEQTARRLLDFVEGPMKSCVVTGGSYEKLLGLARRLRPDYLQLHYDEPLDVAQRLAAALIGQNTRIIKTLPAGPKERRAQLGAAELPECLRRLRDGGIFAALVDPRTRDTAARQGLKADVSFFREADSLGILPVFLAGGITPGTVRSLLEKTGARFLDVMSGVEASPGVKDEAKLRELTATLREREKLDL